MRHSWGFRVARAVTFAGTSVLLAMLGHVLMSGTAVPWWATVMSFAWIATAAWIVADRERGIPFVITSTLVSQAALHTVFSLAQSITQPSSHTRSGMGRGTGMSEMSGMSGEHGGMAHAHHMSGAASAGMFTAHVLAALVCGVWLAYGERAAFSILRSLATRLLSPLRLLAGQQLTEHRPSIRPASSPRPLRDILLVHAITSRGPPRALAVS
ncbi:hypothetical protein [Kribbella solani]|uniref:Uncharacterized protein n=1 Tax=Kribbella solani TaxID=236067 RepID=A0A841DHE2_9ACTN|nr:hypothetical protein [Kribbella solani]MBB5977902.1 hypothetical protein [Kribbella solani]MDX3006299.1 hypothetical protein [Kribbella solani]